jgi:Cu/Ag efflux pump CusA
VVIGGVLSANALTLVVLPAIYRTFGHGRVEEVEETEQVT